MLLRLCSQSEDIEKPKHKPAGIAHGDSASHYRHVASAAALSCSPRVQPPERHRRPWVAHGSVPQCWRIVWRASRLQCECQRQSSTYICQWNIYTYIRLQAVNQLTLILEHTALNMFLPGALFALWFSRYPSEPRLVRIERFVVTTYEEMHRALGQRAFRVVFVATVLSFLRVSWSVGKCLYIWWTISSHVCTQRRDLTQCRQAYWDSNEAVLHYTMPKCWLGILHACRPASRSFEFPEDGAVLWLFFVRMLMISQLGCLRFNAN